MNYSLIRAGLKSFVILGIFFTSGISSLSASSTTPEIKSKFPSKSFSRAVTNLQVNYGGRVRVVFEEGTLFKRRDSLSYDLFFVGRGFAEIIDTSGLNGRFNNRYEFDSGYLCGRELSRHLGLGDSLWIDDKIDRRSWKNLQFMIKTPDNYFGFDISAELGMWARDEDLPYPIWLDLEIERFKQLIVYITPDIPEQLSVYLLDKKYENPQIVTGFSLGNEITTRPAEIDSSQIDINLRDIGRFDASCRLFLPSQVDRGGIKLILPYYYSVDSVLDNTGRHLWFIKKNLRANLYFRFDDGRLGGSEANPPEEVTIFYNGKFLTPGRIDFDMPVNMTSWFPQLPYRNLGAFTINYTLHKDLELISVGERIGETVNGDRKTVTYKTSASISYVSFASGIYDKYADTACGIPITLYARKSSQGLFARSMPRRIVGEISAAYKTFCRWFGEPLTTSLSIVDQPIASYQSSPGLIHLSEGSLYSLDDQPYILSHEVAHQWWGHTAIPASYRDMWLSEGLAEISAALYILRIRNDSTAFEERISHWRRHVTEEGKINGYYSRGYKAGSILQGMRLLESSSIADYVALVYSKAAYMLLMLRFEMDGPDYRTDFFSIMMNEYRRKFSGKQASSVDFMQVVTRFTGVDRASQFFGQWLFGWKIPRFVCHYRIDYDDRERPLVTVRVDAYEVEDGFATPYPMEIEFLDGRREMFRVEAAVSGSEVTLGPFPADIKKIRFNPHYTILSRGQELVEM